MGFTAVAAVGEAAAADTAVTIGAGSIIDAGLIGGAIDAGGILTTGTVADAAFGAASTVGALATAGGGISLLQGLSAGASLLAATGQYKQGQATSEAATMNSEIAANNQIIANNNATATIQEGEQNAAVSSQATKAKIGGILANEGASGVDVNSGSSLDVRQSEQQLGELNAINIRSTAARQAYGYQTEATNAGIQEQIDTSTATNAKTTGDIGAGASLLSGVTNTNSPFSAYLNSQGMGQ